MPNATHVGQATGTGVGSYSTVRFREQIIDGTGGAAAYGFLVSNVIDLNIEVETATVVGVDGFWVRLTGDSADIRVNIKWNKLTCSTNSAYVGISVGCDSINATCVVNGGEIIVPGNGNGIYVTGGTVIGSVDVIRGSSVSLPNRGVRLFDNTTSASLYIGQINGTYTGIEAHNGAGKVFVGEFIDCDQDFTVNAGSLSVSFLHSNNTAFNPRSVEALSTFRKHEPYGYVIAANASYTLTTNAMYIVNNAAGVTLTLPTVALYGDTIKIVGRTGLWTVAQTATDLVYFGNLSTTAGIGGSLTATDAGDCIELVCIEGGSGTIRWRVASCVGNITVV
jgi:hypothetical protein